MTIKDRLKDLSAPSGGEELLNIDFPRPRVHIPIPQAVAVVLLILLGFGVWLLVDHSAEPVSGEVSAQPVLAAAETNDAGVPGEIVVSVVGAVEAPGVYTLSPGARVTDALAQARPLAEADLISLNQAQLLSDGQQIVVTQVGQAAPGISGTGISINSASAQELMTLDGVGEATAQAIIKHRENNGGFSALEDLMDVSGIGPAKFESMKDHITL